MLEEQKYFFKYINVGEIEILKKIKCWRNRNIPQKNGEIKIFLKNGNVGEIEIFFKK